MVAAAVAALLGARTSLFFSPCDDDDCVTNGEDVSLALILARTHRSMAGYT